MMVLFWDATDGFSSGFGKVLLRLSFGSSSVAYSESSTVEGETMGPMTTSKKKQMMEVEEVRAVRWKGIPGREKIFHAKDRQASRV